MNTDGSISVTGSGSGNPTMNTLTDGGNIRSRLVAGLTSDGDVDRAVPTTKGGTGETNTARFLNNSLSFGSLTNGQITINRGGGYSAVTLSGIGKGFVGLNNVDNNSTSTIRGGISINADGTLSGAGGGQVTTSGIGAETPSGAQSRVDGRLSSTEKNRLNAGTSPDNTKTFNNASISISAAGVLSGAGGGTVTTSGIGAETPSGAQTRVDNRLSSTEKNRLNAGTSPDNTKTFNNASISISAAGVLSGAGGGTVTTSGIGAETPSGAQSRVDNRLSSTEKNRLNAGTSPDNTKTFNNASISISSGGVLSGAGGGTVTASGISAIQTNLGNAPNSIKNSQISISAAGALSGAGGGQVTASGLGANTDSTATIRGGITVGSVSSGAPFHSWTIIETDGTTNYNPSSTTASTTFQWRNGNGSLLKQKTITTTIDTSAKDLDVSYGADSGSGSGSVSMSPGTAPTSQTFRKIDLTYSNVTMSLTVSIINMSGWSFK